MCPRIKSRRTLSELGGEGHIHTNFAVSAAEGGDEGACFRPSKGRGKGKRRQRTNKRLRPGTIHAFFMNVY